MPQLASALLQATMPQGPQGFQGVQGPQGVPGAPGSIITVVVDGGGPGSSYSGLSALDGGGV
jgi:hypothetical protein